MEKIIKQKCFWCLFSHVLVACLSTVLSNPMTPRPWVFSAPVLASPRQDDLQYHSLTVATTHTFSLYIYIFFKLFYGPFLLQLLHTSSSLCEKTHFISLPGSVFLFHLWLFLHAENLGREKLKNWCLYLGPYGVGFQRSGVYPEAKLCVILSILLSSFTCLCPLLFRMFFFWFRWTPSPSLCPSPIHINFTIAHLPCVLRCCVPSFAIVVN